VLTKSSHIYLSSEAEHKVLYQLENGLSQLRRFFTALSTARVALATARLRGCKLKKTELVLQLFGAEGLTYYRRDLDRLFTTAKSETQAKYALSKLRSGVYDASQIPKLFLSGGEVLYCSKTENSTLAAEFKSRTPLSEYLLLHLAEKARP
jgi:hypothetical protein